MAGWVEGRGEKGGCQCGKGVRMMGAISLSFSSTRDPHETPR